MPVISPTGKSPQFLLSNFTHSLISIDHRTKPYSNFKPGQTSLERNYYQDATQEKADGSRCLQNYQRFGSDYGKGVSGAVKPGDYKVPCKDANNLVEYDLMNNPKLFAYTRRSQVEPGMTQSMLQKAGSNALGNTTKHWQTNSQHTNETQLSNPISVSQRPQWSYNR